jgi:hypothetical protein
MYKVLKYKKTLDENGNEVLEQLTSFTKRLCGFMVLMGTMYCIQIGGMFLSVISSSNISVKSF